MAGTVETQTLPEKDNVAKKGASPSVRLRPCCMWLTCQPFALLDDADSCCPPGLECCLSASEMPAEALRRSLQPEAGAPPRLRISESAT
eukprot:scaffold3581_cov252-Pinguiococcus_pyrenoidosus.AAC.7